MTTSEAFRCYLDESEASPSALYVVGGFAGRAEVWGKLEAEWAACLPVGISVFHATDCFSGKKSFKGVDIPQRVAVLDIITDVLVAHDVRLIERRNLRFVGQSRIPWTDPNPFLFPSPWS